MDTIIFGKYTLGQVLYAGGAFIALLIVISFVKRLFKTEKISEHVQIVVCANCGWKGQVSRYAGRCPKCSQPLGDLKAKRK